jgi:hypothetical protein
MPAIRWSGANTGINLWDAADNWSRGAVPDSGSDVTIGKNGTYTVVITAADQPFIVASLTLRGTGNHTLLDHGILSVDGSTVIRGNRLDIAADGTANFADVRLDRTANFVDRGVANVFGSFTGSNGTVDISGTLFANAVVGSNSYVLTGGGVFELGGDASSGSTIRFGDNQADSLILDNGATRLAAHVTGLSGGNTIDLAA